MFTTVLGAAIGASLAGATYRRIRSYDRAVGWNTKKSNSYGQSPCEGDKLRTCLVSRLSSGSVLVLAAEFRSAPLGRLLDPVLTVEAGGERHEFWLERGGRGTRYLVLPPGASDGPIRVTGRHAAVMGEPRRWDAGDGTVPEGPILHVAPHPDDAEIAGYGLMREHADRSHVVVVTPGDRGNAYPVGVERPGGWTAWLRRFDALTVPFLAGLAPEAIQSLDFSEGDLADGVASERLAELEDRLAEIVERVRPGAVVVPHPILESHPVHLATTLATLRALRRVGSKAEALFGLIHVPGASRYPLGPREAAIPLPPWFDGEPQFERLVVQRLDPVVQTEKLFALDAHHDLRPAPAALRRAGPLRALRLAGREWVTGVERVASRDYLRRAVRPYEVFLAVSAEGRTGYLERMERGAEPSPRA